ncbi:uncharacterized protein [Henckelia pumila]|uniref:uncharacterized protein isoform X3 n=1 Tax=Henckelia pumila TaxID=405737 RepID=UPI003C6E68E3
MKYLRWMVPSDMMKLDADERILLRGSRGLPNIHHVNDTTMETINLSSSRLSVYGADHGLGSRLSAIGHSGGPIVTQVARTMQVPLAYAEDIIGVQGEILITLDALVVTF